ncbi:uncharacterized protein HMPREF1541_04183 [Cyphellophora europaea CBS 101466]|uniref:Aspartate racemase n=1 Tax=Cyphellophora europaea (strain CBS 101466) TaxID=1220924 RepID=W2S0N9_CYPE1|nr:uncharacterized protein HMPREF1541_04183 [Cyphellophora europaea CBS 101466]ETN42242.1 hypothetical protein HMPREF1541_04183 [Cyphellophora europaea CBS 101466]
MRTIALLGGMTYNATAIYYNIINRQVQKKLGGTHSASLLLQSFDHAEMGGYFTSGQWNAAASKLGKSALNLKAAGADGVMICCNIGHKVADEVERQSGLPLLHIADPTGRIIKEKGISKVALIGTKPVMEDTFFTDRLKTKFGIDVVVPGPEKRNAIQDMIFKELGANIFTAQQKSILLGAIEETVEQGAAGVVFACTELQFVVKPEDVKVPLWDTMEAHASGAADWVLADD